MNTEQTNCEATKNFIIKTQDGHLNVEGTCLHPQAKGGYTEIRKQKEVVAVVYANGTTIAVNPIIKC